MELSLKQIFTIIIKNILFIIITGAVFLTGSFAISKYLIAPTYISSIKMYVISGDENDPNVRPNINDLYYAQQIVNTYIEILKTDAFFNKIVNETKLGYSVDDLKNMVNFKVLNNTEIFQIDVSSESPAYAKFIADSISLSAPLQINEIKENDNVKLVQPAELPTIPASPNITINSVIGLFLGLTISVLITILKEMFDVRVKSIEDLGNKYNIPILGSIPEFSLINMKKGGKMANGR